jgi:hypothetical protein
LAIAKTEMADDMRRHSAAEQTDVNMSVSTKIAK